MDHQLDRQRPLYEAVLPLRIQHAAAAAAAVGAGPEQLVAATVRLLQGTRAGGRERLLYLELVDDAALGPHALADAAGHPSSPTQPRAADEPVPAAGGGLPPPPAAASDGLLHHSVTIAESDYAALAAAQALTVGWAALPAMLAQLLDAARTGSGAGGDDEAGHSMPATPRDGVSGGGSGWGDWGGVPGRARAASDDAGSGLHPPPPPPPPPGSVAASSFLLGPSKPRCVLGRACGRVGGGDGVGSRGGCAHHNPTIARVTTTPSSARCPPCTQTAASLRCSHCPAPRPRRRHRSPPPRRPTSSSPSPRRARCAWWR
jgi:hypothetical protein